MHSWASCLARVALSYMSFYPCLSTISKSDFIIRWTQAGVLIVRGIAALENIAR